jgi:hypothetical protein
MDPPLQSGGDREEGGERKEGMVEEDQEEAPALSANL